MVYPARWTFSGEAVPSNPDLGEVQPGRAGIPLRGGVHADTRWVRSQNSRLVQLSTVDEAVACVNRPCFGAFLEGKARTFSPSVARLRLAGGAQQRFAGDVAALEALSTLSAITLASRCALRVGRVSYSRCCSHRRAWWVGSVVGGATPAGLLGAFHTVFISTIVDQS